MQYLYISNFYFMKHDRNNKRGKHCYWNKIFIYIICYAAYLDVHVIHTMCTKAKQIVNYFLFVMHGWKVFVILLVLFCFVLFSEACEKKCQTGHCFISYMSMATKYQRTDSCKFSFRPKTHLVMNDKKKKIKSHFYKIEAELEIPLDYHFLFLVKLIKQ